MSNIRRYIFLIIILVLAGLISWWSARSEERVVHHIQEEVSKLVPRFISDPTSLQQFVIDPIEGAPYDYAADVMTMEYKG